MPPLRMTCNVCDNYPYQDLKTHIRTKKHKRNAEQKPREARILQMRMSAANKGTFVPKIIDDCCSVANYPLLANPAVSFAYLLLQMTAHKAGNNGLLQKVRTLRPQELDIALGVLAVVQRRPIDWDDTYRPRMRTEKRPIACKKERILECLRLNHKYLLNWRKHCKSESVLPFLKDKQAEDGVWPSRLRSRANNLTQVLEFLTDVYNHSQYEIKMHNRQIQKRINKPNARFVYLKQDNVVVGDSDGIVLFVRNWNNRHLKKQQKKGHQLYTIDPYQPGEKKEPVGLLYLAPWNEAAAQCSPCSMLTKSSSTKKTTKNTVDLLRFRGEYVGYIVVSHPKHNNKCCLLPNGVWSGIHSSWLWDPYKAVYIPDITSNGGIDVGLTADDPRVVAALGGISPSAQTVQQIRPTTSSPIISLA